MNETAAMDLDAGTRGPNLSALAYQSVAALIRGCARCTCSSRMTPLRSLTPILMNEMRERRSSGRRKGKVSDRTDEMAAGYGLTSFGQVWSPHSFGRNLLGGSSRLPEAIAEVLGLRLQLGAEVLRIEPAPGGVAIDYHQNGADRRVLARHVIVATQADVAHRVIAGLPADTRDALGRIRYGAFLSAAVLTDEVGPMPWDNNYAISTPGLSFSVFFNQASTPREDVRRPGGSLMLFRGARGAAELMRLSDREIAERLKADLEKLFPEARGIVREIEIQRWPQGAPYSFPGRAELQPALTRDLGRTHLAGDYLEFPCMDAAISTATEAAARIDAALDAQPHTA
jgi:oxygen-dependent protoporphyrinogen oxidase